MNNINTPAETAVVANQPELTEGLFVLELEERLELATAAAAAAACERCDVEL
ncbi:hypothetical protein GCM10027048_34840 [Hymenobacter coalescens]